MRSNIIRVLRTNRLAKNLFRSLCTSVEKKIIPKVVYVSQSHDIFTNLALEDWIYKNVSCEDQHILMLWSNDPCVVIGRHQNPWLEANIPALTDITDKGVHLARRNSGGGTVYHDKGNLNLTFFTTRKEYNRRRNLEFIQRVLNSEFDTNVEISKREDLVIRDFKISGTASKLGRLASYHHCTLLVKANKSNLSKALNKLPIDIRTNATQSVKSKIMNLTEENSKITMENLLESLGNHFLENQTKEFKVIEPEERFFPGIEELRENLKKWDWIFGKSPKFTLVKTFAIPDDLNNSKIPQELNISILVENGLINDVNIGLPVDMVGQNFTETIDLISTLKGQRFTSESIWKLEGYIKEDVGFREDYRSQFVVDCFKKIVTNS